jgi:vacuolar-type H+-ATPase subunit D/Vma8
MRVNTWTKWELERIRNTVSVFTDMLPTRDRPMRDLLIEDFRRMAQLREDLQPADEERLRQVESQVAAVRARAPRSSAYKVACARLEWHLKCNAKRRTEARAYRRAAAKLVAGLDLP